MEHEVSRLRVLGETLTEHGTAIVVALAILICGLLTARWLHNTLSRRIKRLYPDNKAAPVACNSLHKYHYYCPYHNGAGLPEVSKSRNSVIRIWEKRGSSGR